MQRLRTILTLTLLTPVLGIVVLSSGCGKSGDQGGGAQSTESQPGPSGEKPKAVVVKDGETGTIKGRVVFAGTPPMLPPVSERTDFKDNANRSHCEKGPTANPTWVVGADGGVANVFVWVKAPGRDYFVLPDAKRKDSKQVEVDQPYCAFEPHAVVLYPFSRDEKGGTKATGQTFVVKNSAPVNHNTKVEGSSKANPLQNVLINGKKDDKVEQKVFEIKPDTQPITIQCDLHKWMTGYVWAFDHPYAAITNQNGNFEIKDVPAGSEIYVVAWHEGDGGKFLLPQGKGSGQGEKIVLKPGETKEIDITIKK